MSNTESFEYEINMIKKDNYKFEVDFGKSAIPDLLLDESEEIPGGEGLGPTASMLLAAAVGNCLSASLIFCVTKKKLAVTNLKTKVKFTRKRNEDGFWRISKIDVNLEPEVESKEAAQYIKCVDIFRNYCIVSGSIKAGIPINVTVDGK
ncbi:MAG: OsmC family peroxiredoxin [Candidatus Heimdallarchaeota archaeon]|nr:MAG: OsmC family peroxiredoxin [Candidatus Heimdallarchaeota archaeon]